MVTLSIRNVRVRKSLSSYMSLMAEQEAWDATTEQLIRLTEQTN